MPKQKAEPLPPRVCRLKAHLGPVILQESAKRKIKHSRQRQSRNRSLLNVSKLLKTGGILFHIALDWKREKREESAIIRRI